MCVLDTFQFSKEPDNPTIVVEGVKSANVSLSWVYVLESDESLLPAKFARQGPGEVRATTIASRFGGNTYSYRESFANEYKANLDSELILLNLHNNKEYIYTFEVTYAEGADSFTPDSTITVIVKGKKPLFSN